MPSLTDRVAFITGADSGMGAAMAEAFAEAGASVAITYHSDRAGAEASRQAAEAKGGRAFVKQLDVRDEGAVFTAFEEAEAALGQIDILVNNAGVGQGGTALADLEMEEFDRIVRTDLYGPFLCCREFIRRKRGRKGGKIVNITSVHEAIPSPGSAAYGAAKGGLLTLTRSLAMELAEQKINVNAIAPGLIRTPMTEARTEDPATRAEEMPHIPLHRPGEPWEVARLALYLASDEADYVTGQSFTIDGGLEMNWGQGA